MSNKGVSMCFCSLEEHGGIPWHARSNPQFAAERPLSGTEIDTINDAVKVDPVAVFCAVLPELHKRKISVEGVFSYFTEPDGNSKTGYTFRVNAHGQVPVDIRKKVPHSGRTFTKEERQLFAEMVACNPDVAVSDGMQILQQRGLITSAWYLAADETHSQ
ncbi:hypothetical protein LMM39_001693 [Salmonella enterica]|nr:hypothetical protein [Salmonella enterica]EIJ8269984.1 hypothetical protein [Salmonella enterica]EIM0099957.1 hypothetical protein [Salmonella enterica]EIM4714188.1 hypothetical protein [Salmonella enterica]